MSTLSGYTRLERQNAAPPAGPAEESAGRPPSRAGTAEGQLCCKQVPGAEERRRPSDERRPLRAQVEILNSLPETAFTAVQYVSGNEFAAPGGEA